MSNVLMSGGQKPKKKMYVYAFYSEKNLSSKSIHTAQMSCVL